MAAPVHAHPTPSSHHSPATAGKSTHISHGGGNAGHTTKPPGAGHDGHSPKPPTAGGKVGHTPKPPTPGGKGQGGEKHKGGDYHLRHGTKFHGGYCYKGRHHHHWTHRYWWGKYGCFAYWCPSTLAWYYWYGPDNVYYPVSYIDRAIPQMESPPEDVASGVTRILYVPVDANVAGRSD
jgi:hypothetical protein